MTAVYLDHAATTPMRLEVIGEMSRVMKEVYGNPSSIHQFGRRAAFELETARDKIAEFINAYPYEITFNGGGTEGNNTVLTGIAHSLSHQGKHIITTMIEHAAVLNPLKELEEEGFDITYLETTPEGSVTVEQVEQALRPDTILVSIMYGNNEIGTLNPISEIGDLLKSHPALFHTDAVQAFGSESVDVQLLNVDYLTASAHKVNGPKGVGILYSKRNAPAVVLIHGGEQEEKRRAGTENVPGVVGFAKAIECLTVEEKQRNRSNYISFKQLILDTLDDHNIRYEINGQSSNMLPHIMNIWFPGVPNHVLLSRLDLLGFAISTGSACSSGNVKPSPILEHIYPNEKQRAQESIRISFGYGLDMDSIRQFSVALTEIINDILTK